MNYFALKHSHLLFVLLSILLFNLRFFIQTWKNRVGLPKLLRTTPPIIDTLLLLSGIGLAHIAHFIPWSNAPWLSAKIVLLVGYIFFGIKALKVRPRTAKSFVLLILSNALVLAIIYFAVFKPTF